MTMFNVVSPESVGVKSSTVAEYISHLKQRGVVMHSLMLTRGYDIFAEYYYAPFNKDFRHRMYSQTKSDFSIAIGLLEEEGKLNLDDKIVDLFPEYAHENMSDNLKEQTVRDMLKMELQVLLVIILRHLLLVSLNLILS